MIQSELELEQNLIKRLTGLGYEPVNISNAEDLKANLKAQLEKHNKAQLEKHNKTQFSDEEFKQILNYLDKGSIFDRAKRLRDEINLNCDDGTSFHINLLNIEHWRLCRSLFGKVPRLQNDL